MKLARRSSANYLLNNPHLIEREFKAIRLQRTLKIIEEILSGRYN